MPTITPVATIMMAVAIMMGGAVGSASSQAASNCRVPIPTLLEQMIQESIARYPGNCACPYSRDARGRKGRAVAIGEADRFAAKILPIVESLEQSGITSLRGIAIALNNRWVRTACGGHWQVSNVRNVLGRLNI